MDKSAHRPNVIWIFGDQHRGQALSCRGDPNVNTPVIDRLMTEGAAFSAAVAGMPLCCPFRGSLVSGLYPHKAVPGHEYQLDPATGTIAHALGDAGYHTAYFGKWHLDGWHERDGRAAMHIVPPERRGGFDVWVGYENNNAQWDSWVHGGEGENAFHHRLEGYETDVLTDMFIEHLRGHTAEAPDRPLFAVLSVQPPHDPYLAPPEFMRRHNPATLQLRPNVPCVDAIQRQARRELAGYYAQIENLDWNVGRVLDGLDELGIDDDTWVLFFSDHGDMHGSHGQFRKMTAYEEAVRVPCVAWKRDARYACNRRPIDAPINHVDIAPTTLGLCGLEVPTVMQGYDYSGLIRPGPAPADLPDSAFLQSVVPTGHGNSVDRPWRGIVTRDGWKYACFEQVPWMLYNLNDDPYEQVNLAHNAIHRAKRRELNDRLAAWIADTGDSFALPDVDD